jgi:hypothetical protein
MIARKKEEIPYLGPEIFSCMQARLKPETDESQSLVRPDKRSRRPAPSPLRQHYSISAAATFAQLIRRTLRSVKGRKRQSSKSDGI